MAQCISRQALQLLKDAWKQCCRRLLYFTINVQLNSQHDRIHEEQAKGKGRSFLCVPSREEQFSYSVNMQGVSTPAQFFEICVCISIK